MSELGLLLGLNHLAASHPWVGKLATFFAQDGPYLLMGVLILLWFVRPRKDRRTRQAIVYAVLSAALAVLLTVAIGALVFRERPVFAYPHLIHALVTPSHDSSFPSDHAAGSFAIATAMFFAGGEFGTPFLIVAFAIAISRVAVGVHWPTDVLVGAVLGMVCGWGIVRVRSIFDKPLALLMSLFGYGHGPQPHRGA